MKNRPNAKVIGFVCLVAGIAIVWAAYKGTFGDAVVRVENQTSVPLYDIQLTGTGWEYVIGLLKPGAAAEFLPAMNGASAVAVSFLAAGKRHEAPRGGYFESSGGYVVNLTINPDFGIHDQTDITRFSAIRIVSAPSPQKIADRFTADKCEAAGGRVVRENESECKSGEISRGKVWNAQCACVCCVPKEG